MLKASLFCFFFCPFVIQAYDNEDKCFNGIHVETKNTPIRYDGPIIPRPRPPHVPPHYRDDVDLELTVPERSDDRYSYPVVDHYFYAGFEGDEFGYKRGYEIKQHFSRIRNKDNSIRINIKRNGRYAWFDFFFECKNNSWEHKALTREGVTIKIRVRCERCDSY